MRLSPRDRIIGLRHLELGAAELGLGHFDAAAEEYHKAIDTGFVSYLPYVELAIAHSLEGKPKRRRPPWRKPAASIPNSPSNG